MHRHKAVTAAFLLLLPTLASATGTGQIANLSMSGPSDPNHPNVAQIDFGGDILTSTTCNKRFVGIRKTDENAHLISLAIAAAVAGKPVFVVENPAAIYFTSDGRCTVSRLAIEG